MRGRVGVLFMGVVAMAVTCIATKHFMQISLDDSLAELNGLLFFGTIASVGYHRRMGGDRSGEEPPLVLSPLF